MGEDLEPSPGSALPRRLRPELEGRGRSLAHNFGLSPTGRAPDASKGGKLARCQTPRASGCWWGQTRRGDFSRDVTEVPWGGEPLCLSPPSPALLGLGFAAAEAEERSRCVRTSPRASVCPGIPSSMGAPSRAPPYPPSCRGGCTGGKGHPILLPFAKLLP